MKQARILNVLGLIFNLAIVGLVSFAVFEILGNVLDKALLYFTVLSNLLVAVAALINIPFNIVGIAKGKRLHVLPYVCKLIGTVSVSIVLIVVVFVFAPQDNWNIANQFGNFSLTAGEGQFYLHLIVPVLSIISFLVFDHSRKLKFPVNFFSIIPLAIYSAFYAINYFVEIIPESERDLYNLVNIGGSTAGAALIGGGILVGAFLLSVIYWLLNGVIRDAIFKEEQEAPVAANEELEEEPEPQVEEEPVQEEAAPVVVEEEPVEEQPVEEEPVQEEKAEEVEEQPVEEPVEEEAKEEKPAPKKAAAKKAPAKAEPKKEEKPAKAETKKEAPKKAEPKAEAKEAAAPASKEGPTKVYHLTKRKEDGMWAITFVGGQKAVKLFKTKKEAEEALAVLTQNQGATALIRNSKGAKAGKFASSIKAAEKETK